MSHNTYRHRARRQRERLFQEQRGLCFYCGKPMLLATGGSNNPPHMATLDHIIPTSKGGARGPTINAVAACLRCNQERGNQDARLFMLKKQGAL